MRLSLYSVLDNMRAHLADVDVMEQLFLELGGLSFSAQNDAAICSRDDLKCLLHVLLEDHSNSVVVKGACLTLGNVCLDTQSKATIARLGGLELLVRVMRAHRIDAAVMEHTSFMLGKATWQALRRPRHRSCGLAVSSSSCACFESTSRMPP